MSHPEQMTVDLELLSKYSAPLRPAAYRLAPRFHSGFGADALREEILATSAADDVPDISLYLHLPFCSSLCHYCGCTVVITQDARLIEDYLEDLKKEIALVASLAGPGRNTVQVQWGGGTPNYLSPEQIRDLFGCIISRFVLADDAEVGIEIDPRQLRPDHLATMREVGFNCVTFGVQDLDPRVQEAINRVQPEALTAQAIAESRSLGFETICADLIYGLPYQDERSFTHTLQRVADLGPDRVAVFGYGHIPRLKSHQQALESSPRADHLQRLRLFKTTIETLTAAGYVYIGMDQFALPSDHLARAREGGNLHRNLQGYSAWGGTDLHGLGVTGISQLQRVYAQNAKSTADYKETVNQGRLPAKFGCRLNQDDKLRGHVVSELVCRGEIDKEAIAQRFDVDFDAYFCDSRQGLDELVADGLLRRTPGRLRLTERGRPLLRSIIPVLCHRI